MDFQILDYQSAKEDLEITSLLTRVFVGEGYTDKSDAEKMFAPAELQKRGEIMLARSSAGKLLGVIIFVLPPSPARQVAEAGEAEIHLLAVCNEARGHGVASRLIMACKQRAASRGYPKIVLSTQQTMKEAHRVYGRLGYKGSPARDWSRKGRVFLVYEKLLKI